MSMSFADVAMVSDYTGAQVENDTRRARHEQYTHGLRIIPHTCIHHIISEYMN